MFPFSAFGSDGWAAATGLGSDWAPFMFLSHLLRRMGGPRPRGLGFHSAPFMFLSRLGSDGWAAATGLRFHWLPSCSFLGRMGGPRPRGWAPTGLPSSPCKALRFLSRLVGRMGGPRPRGWAPAGLPSCSFLGSWVGGWAAATGLGSMFLSRLLGRMGGPRPRGWACAGLPSCSFLGLGRVGGPRPRGWALTGLGRMGGPRPLCSFNCGKKAGLLKGLPSHFLSGLLGRMGQQTQLVGRSPPHPTQPNMKGAQLLGRGLPIQRSPERKYKKPNASPASWPHPSDPARQQGAQLLGSGPPIQAKGAQQERSFLAAARGQEAGLLLGSAFFLGPGSDGWAAAKRLGSKGSLHIPGSDGWAAAKMLGLHWAPFILFRLLGAWVGRAGNPSCFFAGVLGRISKELG